MGGYSTRLSARPVFHHILNLTTLNLFRLTGFEDLRHVCLQFEDSGQEVDQHDT